MRYGAVTQLRWANMDHTAINAWVAFEGFAQPLPFTASATDVEAHGRDIYARAVAGEFGPIEPMEGG